MELVSFKRIILLSIMTLVMLSGCATQPVVSTRYVWPPPPEQPKIEWLRSIYAQNDFPKSTFVTILEEVFGKPSQVSFNKPIDIKSNGKGLVYVTDIALSGIFRIDFNNETTEFWKRGDDPDNSLALTPYYISLDTDGNVYVVGTGSKQVFVVDAKGTFLRKFDYSAKMTSPGGILVDSSRKRVYLVDTGASKVSIFSLTGEFIASFGQKGEGDGEFNRPIPITMNSKHEIIIGDVLNARLQIFDGDGRFLRKFGQRGDGPGDFQIIKGVAVDSDDNVYVTDGKASQIKIFSSRGDYLMTFGKAYSVPQAMKESPGGFLLPQGIHVDATDTIYVADQANMRFQVFRYLKAGPKAEGGSPGEGK